MLRQCPMYAYIPAKDVARARRFYEDKVGLIQLAQLRIRGPQQRKRHSAGRARLLQRRTLVRSRSER